MSMIRTLLALVMAAAAAETSAATFCVGDSTQLVNALNTASSNGQNDSIRIRVGTYPLVNANRFEVLAENGTSTTVSGGWLSLINSCDLQTNTPESTVLTASQSLGDQVLRVQSISGNGSVELANLSLKDGRGLGSNAGCMNIQVEAGTAQITVDRIVLSGCENSQTLSPGALAVQHLGTNFVTVRNSIIRDNVSQSGPAVSLYQRAATSGNLIRFFNNTVFDNHPVTSGGVVAGVQANSISGQGGIELYNNVIVDNGLPNQPDVGLVNDGTSAYSTMLSKAISGTPLQSGGTQITSNVAGLFRAYPSDLRPTDQSALRDAGSDLNASAAGQRDFSNGTRVQGSRIDIGAFEFESLFRNGFE